MDNAMTVAMLGCDDSYSRYALMPSYTSPKGLNGMQSYLGGYLMDNLQETGFTTTAEKEKDVSSMSSKEKANFFAALLQKGADVAIAALNEKQAESNKAAEVAELERAKALIEAGEGGKLMEGGNGKANLQQVMPFLIGGAAILLVGGVLISANRRRRRR